MKVLFIGCVESSSILLKKLIEINAEIVGVITKSDSKFNADFFDLAPLCKENQIEFVYVDNVNELKSIEFVKKVNPDIAFCFGWSQLIKEEFIDLLPMGIVGFHPAELPNNRGRHPIIWALALGLQQTASSFFMIDKDADTGDIVSQEKIAIEYQDDAKSLYQKIMNVAEQQVVDIYMNFENNSVKRVKQTAYEGNSWRKRSKTDGEINFRMGSRAIYNLVRSLTHPYVGAHLIYNEKEIKVWKVKEVYVDQIENIEPGKVLAINDDGSIDVKAYDNVIRLLEYDKFSIEVGEYIK